MTQTNETNCILARDCAHAGWPAKCTDRCPHFAQLHSATGRHTRAGLPAKYALTTLADAPPRADQPEVYGAIDRVVASFSRQFDAKPAIKSLSEHIERYCGTTLNKLTTAELARALFVGYTVELTEAEKHEKVKEAYYGYKLGTA